MRRKRVPADAKARAVELFRSVHGSVCEWCSGPAPPDVDSDGWGRCATCARFDIPAAAFVVHLAADIDNDGLRQLAALRLKARDRLGQPQQRPGERWAHVRRRAHRVIEAPSGSRTPTAAPASCPRCQDGGR
jgi:hypothetical protein